MPLVIVAVLLAAVILAALLILMAASAAESAVRLAGIERRRDHLRRVGEATHDVQLAADHYQRAMDSSLERSSGDGVLARRAEEVRDAAHRYQETCRRLVRVLAGGSRPPGSRHLLDLLTDPHHPEAVATARPADGSSTNSCTCRTPSTPPSSPSDARMRSGASGRPGVSHCDPRGLASGARQPERDHGDGRNARSMARLSYRLSETEMSIGPPFGLVRVAQAAMRVPSADPASSGHVFLAWGATTVALDQVPDRSIDAETTSALD